MKKDKVIKTYYPRKNFWKFWEKRAIKSVDTWLYNDDHVTEVYSEYRPNGVLKKHGVYVGTLWCMDPKEYIEFYPNGHKRLHQCAGEFTKEFFEDGTLRRLQQGCKEIHYYLNGQVMYERDHATQAYAEYSWTGALMHKGTMDSKNKFFPGKSAEKQKDLMRQDFVRVMNDVSFLPANDPHLKQVKRNIVEAWHMVRAWRERA